MEKNKQKRKEIPLYKGLIKYFPDALCEVARVSYIGSKQHHPDEEIHWDKVCPILPVSDAVEISDKELSQVVDPLPSMAVDAIHDGLKLLTASCDGATSWDDRGYSKFDTTVGKSLSRSPFLTPKQQRLGQKLIHKYRRQLDPDLVAVATQGGN